VIDNTIVMTDHIRHHHDRKAFLSILAATLTTMGALVIIFFLDEKIRLNLQDFAAGSDHQSGGIFVHRTILGSGIDRQDEFAPEESRFFFPKSPESLGTTSGGPSDTVVHTPFPSLFLSLLPGADPFPLQLEKAGLPYSSTGFRTTDIFIAGEDRAGREGSIRKGLFVDRSLQ